MGTSPTPGTRGRETRLLLVTIAISVGVLLLLARFRFPEEAGDRPVEAAPAPLERLAAQATYDELASIMADLERRIAARVWILRSSSPEGAAAGLVVAPRLTPDRAVTLMNPGDTLESATAGTSTDIVAQDPGRGVAVVRVPAVDDGAVTLRTGIPRRGPRYVGVVEPTAQGPVLRPVYVGRVEVVADARTGTDQLSLAGLQHSIPRGAAIFTLDGLFVGLVRDSGDRALVITGEFLRTAMDAAQASPRQAPVTLGVDLQALTPALIRATGADRGVVITHVEPTGPSGKLLQAGDVVQAIDGTPVSTVAGFRQQEASRAPGANVTVTGVRLGAPLQVAVVAADAAAPAAEAPEDGPGFIGQGVAGAGVEVVMVGRRSPADLAGLEPGDLIVSLDGQPDPGVSDIARRYRSTAAGRALLLTVRRGERHHVLALEKR